jgi:hypothetical protein
MENLTKLSQIPGIEKLAKSQNMHQIVEKIRSSKEGRDAIQEIKKNRKQLIKSMKKDEDSELCIILNGNNVKEKHVPDSKIQSTIQMTTGTDNPKTIEFELIHNDELVIVTMYHGVGSRNKSACNIVSKWGKTDKIVGAVLLRANTGDMNKELLTLLENYSLPIIQNEEQEEKKEEQEEKEKKEEQEKKKEEQEEKEKKEE